MPLLERPGGETTFADHLKRLSDRLGGIATAYEVTKNELEVVRDGKARKSPWFG